MLNSDLDIRLEPRIKELYQLHKERSANIDWAITNLFHGTRPCPLNEFLGMRVK